MLPFVKDKSTTKIVSPVLSSPRNTKIKSWFGAAQLKITLSYLVIVTIGITTFYFAKKEVNENRQFNMKIKQEINQPLVNYPNRFELFEAEKKSKAQN